MKLQEIKWNVFLLVVLLAVGLTACSGNTGAINTAGNTDGNTGNAQETNNANPTVPVEEKGDKYDPPIVITTVKAVGDDIIYKEGEDYNNNVWNKYLSDKMGINVKYLWTTDNSQYKTKLSLSLTANEPMPDVFHGTNDEFDHQLIDSGKLMDITDVFEKYASPRLKELYGKHPEVWNAYSRNGRKFGLPLFGDAVGGSDVMWIRQDWLDKLDLKAPTTLNEMEQVMDAFIKKDPDGNGKADTIGLSISLKDGAATWVAGGSPIFGAYGTTLGNWIKKEDGSIGYSDIHPGVKMALLKMQEWLKKGYIDKEAGTMDGPKAAESFANGTSGIMFGPAWSGDWPLGDLTKNIPGAVMVAAPLPSGPDGTIGRKSGPLNGYQGLFFSKDFQNIEAFFKVFDKIYDPMFQEGDFKNGFAEGYDYILKDGQPLYEESQIPGGKKYNVAKYTFAGNQPGIPYLKGEIYKSLFDGKAPLTPLEIALATTPKVTIQGYTVDGEMQKYDIGTDFTGAPTETMKTRNDILYKMEVEAFLKIIYGKASADSFDTFVKDWLSNGGEKITQEVNEWYKASVGQ